MMKYKKLELDEKIKIIKYEMGAYELATVEFYESASQFPKCPLSPQDYFMGNALGLDFREDIYHNKLIDKLSKKEEVEQFMMDKYDNWFLGDALTMKFVDYIAMFRHGVEVKKDTVEELERELKKIYNDFLLLAYDKVDTKYGYIKAGEFNGETLYKRVKKRK